MSPQMAGNMSEGQISRIVVIEMRLCFQERHKHSTRPAASWCVPHIWSQRRSNLSLPERVLFGATPKRYESHPPEIAVT